MPLEIIVRQAAPSDAENLAVLGMQVWLHTYATEGIYTSLSHFVLSKFITAKFIERIQDANCALFLAECNNRLVSHSYDGMAQHYFNPPAIWLHTTTILRYRSGWSIDDTQAWFI